MSCVRMCNMLKIYVINNCILVDISANRFYKRITGQKNYEVTDMGAINLYVDICRQYVAICVVEIFSSSCFYLFIRQPILVFFYIRQPILPFHSLFSSPMHQNWRFIVSVVENYKLYDTKIFFANRYSIFQGHSLFRKLNFDTDVR